MVLFKYLEDKKSEIQGLVASYSSERKLMSENQIRSQELSVKKQSLDELKSTYLACDLVQSRKIAEEVHAKSKKLEHLQTFLQSVQAASEIVCGKIRSSDMPFENNKALEGLYVQKIALETRWLSVSQEIVVLQKSIASQINEISTMTELSSKLNCEPEPAKLGYQL